MRTASVAHTACGAGLGWGQGSAARGGRGWLRGRGLSFRDDTLDTNITSGCRKH